MYDEDLTELEDGIRRLKVEYDIFFNGHRKKPPDELRFRVEKLVKRLSEAGLSFQERFRYTSLIGRFYVYRDLWRRNQMERELGAEMLGIHGDGSSARPKKPAECVSISVTDPEKEDGKVRQLFDMLQRIRKRNPKNPPLMPYDQFVKYVAGRTRGIQGRYGCSRVVFTVSASSDVIKFTAKADKKV